MNAPDSKVHGANMGPIWGRQDPGGPHDAPRTLLYGAILTQFEQNISNTWHHSLGQ